MKIGLDCWMRKLLDAVCVGCATPLAATARGSPDNRDDRSWCPRCWHTLLDSRHRRAHNLPDADLQGFVDQRLAKPIFCGGCYQSPLDQIVVALKFQRQLWAARAIADAIDFDIESKPQAWAQAAIEILIPVPLSAERQTERGFNQSLEIARHLNRKHRKLRIDTATLRRRRATAAQSSLSRSQRAVNMEAAFVASPDLKGRRVAVIDDVLTTGATLTSAIEALEAQQVIVVAAIVGASAD